MRINFVTFLFVLLQTGLFAQSEEVLRSNFQDPNLDHRMNINQHDYPTTTTQLNDLYDITLERNGYRGMTVNVSKSNYLDSESNFSWFVNATKTAKAKGYDLWLYDEKLYPSGMADTKVLDAHPDWEAEGLFIFKKNASSNQTVSVTMQGTLVLAKAVPVSTNGTILYDNAIDISASFNNGTFSYTTETGTWRIVVATIGVLYTGFQAGEVRGTEAPRYPSLLMPEVTDMFVDLTHKKYAAEFGEKLGNYFTSTFTDEPSTMALPYNQLGYAVFPWKKVLSDKLSEKYGYNLVDKILKITLDTGTEGEMLRYQYFKTVSELISQNYFGKIKEYCHTQDLLTGGHLLLEESLVAHVTLYGSIMDCYRQLDIPGVDCLTGLPYKTRSYMFSSRLASSATELQGNSRVMFESCPIDNDLPNLQEPPTIDIKGVHNRMMVGGVTDYNNYLKLSYENFAGRKEFNDYTARVVSMLSGGKRASHIAVYYPIETVWTKYKPLDMRLNTWWSVQGADPEVQSIESTVLNLTYGLIDNGWEFSFIDALGLEESTVTGSQLSHGEDLKWDVLILPYTEVLPRTAYNRVVEFVNSGGHVIALRRLPDSSESEFPAEDITNKFVEYNNSSAIIYNSTFDMTQLNSQLEGILERPITFDNYEGIMHSHRLINGKDVFFIINDKKENRNLQITLPSNRNWELWNPQTGEITTVSSGFNWTFEPYDGIILRAADETQAVRKTYSDVLKIYPNPVFDAIKINVGNEQIKSVNIYDPLGRVIKTFHDPATSYNVYDLINGNYIVSVQTEQNSYKQHFVKQ